MRLIKIQDGLLEHENYFLTAPSGDFLGTNQYSRDNNAFTLKDGYIERPFPYDNFVIVIEKQQEVMTTEDELSLYIRKKHLKSGLIETMNMNYPSSKYWKLTRYKEYVQGYSSDNGASWNNVGGGGIMPLQDVQGFSIKGDIVNLKIKDYKVYRNPYVKFLGLTEGNIGVIVDSVGNIIDEKVVDSIDEIELFLQNVIEGKLIVYEDSSKTNKLFESNKTLFQFGDVFNFISHDLSLYYKGVVLNENPTMLHAIVEMTTLRNLSSTDTYNNVLIATLTNFTDTIELSLDNISFSDEVVIPSITPNQNIDIYIKITKDQSNRSFSRRDFDLIIDV